MFRQFNKQFKKFLAFRQKTSRFMKSDSGCSIETEASIKDIAYPPPHSYHEPSAFNQSGSSLKRAEAPRSYSPKSEFLKKLKYPCYCAENKQQRQSIPPNSNSCSDFIPKVCEVT